MLQLDNNVDSLIAKYSWSLDETYTMPVDPSERMVAKSLKAQATIKLNSARIKLHRYHAFLDAPVFTQKHCDLVPAANGQCSETSTCSCSSLLRRSLTIPTDNARRSSSSSSASSSSPVDMWNNSPYSSMHSAKVCMKAALTVSRAFESLPYPTPTQAINSNRRLSDLSRTLAPRTMPAFACCAMQSGYALLMLCHRTREMNQSRSNDHAVNRGLEELYAGLHRILDTLKNYSIAFEALDGMRGKC